MPYLYFLNVDIILYQGHQGSLLEYQLIYCIYIWRNKYKIVIFFMNEDDKYKKKWCILSWFCTWYLCETYILKSVSVRELVTTAQVWLSVLCSLSHSHVQDRHQLVSSLWYLGIFRHSMAHNTFWYLRMSSIWWPL